MNIKRPSWTERPGLVHFLALMLIVVCAHWPQPSLAQSPSQSGTVVPGVTVQGRKPNPGPAVVPTPEQRAFVKSHAAPSRIGQMTRWRQSICPTTLGLSDAMNAFVSERVKAVAAEVGAPSGPCKSNVVIVFTTEPQKLLDNVRKKAPTLLGFHYPAQAKRIARVNYPIQAWYVTATTSTGSGGGLGAAGAGVMQGALGAADQGAGVDSAVIDDDCCGTPGGCAGRGFTACLSNQIVAVIVVANRNQIAGMTIGSISDDIAMLVLTKVDLSQGCSEPASITNLMTTRCDEASKPTALTADDIAYLKALYAINMGQLMWVQRDSLADIMASVLNDH